MVGIIMTPKNMAEHFCKQIHWEYTRDEVQRFSSGIIGAWKVGKRLNNEENEKKDINNLDLNEEI